MRVLIFSAAVLACATAAPFATPYGTFIVHNPVPLVPIPPGDVQAAVIDSKVQVEDFVRAANDHARELVEQAVEKQNEGVNEANDLAKEKVEESFWTAEEKKWQALDALKTAEARLDGAFASGSPTVAKSAYVFPGAVVAPASVVAPAAAVIAPVGISHTEVVAEAKAAAPSDNAKEAQKVEGEASAAVKSVEAESKPAENAEKSAAADNEAVQVDSAAAVKSAEEKKEEGSGILALSQTHPAPVLSAALAQPWLNPAIAPVSYISGLKSYVSPFVPSYSSPVYFRAGW